MQIHLPDNPKIGARAFAQGFASVDEYVRHLVEMDAAPLEPEDPASEGLSYVEWKKRFDAFLASLKSWNPNLDDSREAIYSDR